MKRDVDETLRRHWEDFASRFSFPFSESYFEFILTKYGEPHRRYHGKEHILFLLDELKAARIVMPERFANPAEDAAMEFALWDHDIFHDPRSQTNEEESAAFAVRQVSELGFSGVFARRVQFFIMETKHAAAPTDPSAQVVVDLDLTPLGIAPAAFNKNSAEIREEYAFVPDEDFRKKQGGFLRALLARPAIYSTPYAGNKYEWRARQNLLRALRE